MSRIEKTIVVDRRIEGDLERFQEYVEDLGSSTGYWPGAIHGDDVSPGTSVDRTAPSTAALHHPDPSSRAPRGRLRRQSPAPGISPAPGHARQASRGPDRIRSGPGFGWPISRVTGP